MRDVAAARREMILGSRPERVRKLAFLASYGATANVSDAAVAAGVSPGRANGWIKDARSRSPQDKVFAEQFLDAEQQACDSVEREIHRRAMIGIDEPIVASGEMVWQAFRKKTGEPLPTHRDRGGALVVTTQEGVVLEREDFVVRPLTIKRYSDRLLLARARSLMPERYGESVGTMLTRARQQAAQAVEETRDDEIVIDVRDAVVVARGNGSVH